MSARALWLLDELVAATGGRLVGHVSGPLNGVSIDSRTLAEGDIFIAIDGDNQDGHRFVADAVGKGAGLAIVSTPDDAMAAAGALLVVDDTLSALEALGRAARARSLARIVAITGSVGKTGTKDALKLALSGSGIVHASAASYNNQWGVPLSLARMPVGADYGVFEVGMNHPGEITPLVKMVAPHVAIITSIEPVHLGFFKSVDQIAAAKAEILDGLDREGTIILNRDNSYFDFLSDQASKAGIKSIIGFGKSEMATARLLDGAYKASGSCVRADIMGQAVAYRLGVPGRHVVMNSLAVLAAVSALGADLALACLALDRLEPAPGRGIMRKFQIAGGEITLIDESYNANPASMRAALAVLGDIAAGPRIRKIAILGDMLELGDHARTLHEQLLDPIVQAHMDMVYLCGGQMAALWNVLPDHIKGLYGASSSDLLEDVCDRLEAGDVIMVKGSLGSKMALVVEAISAKLDRHGGGG